MSGDVTNLVPSVVLERVGSVVIIELDCSDDLAAVVLFEDITQKITSGRGLQLRLRGLLVSESGAS